MVNYDQILSVIQIDRWNERRNALRKPDIVSKCMAHTLFKRLSVY